MRWCHLCSTRIAHAENIAEISMQLASTIPMIVSTDGTIKLFDLIDSDDIDLL